MSESEALGDRAALIDRMIAKIEHQHGPGPGGGRGAGRPWGGIVEDTPALWVTWLVDAAHRLGRPVPAQITIGGQPVHLVAVTLTFGQRWYFRCPDCGRRCEALYFLGRRFGCRKCLHLGYRSQASRPGSVYAWLDYAFSRKVPWGWNRFEISGAAGEGLIRDLVPELRADLKQRIKGMLDQVSIEAGSVGSE